MRILIMSGGLLATALVHTSSTPAAAGPWCYLNENEHCDQVSFESCHFGTFGNGGYCYTNASYRWREDARAHARAYVTVSTAPRWGYTDHYAYYGRSDWSSHWRGDWSSRWSGRWYSNDWFYGGSYAFYATPTMRTAFHHRHHHHTGRAQELVASARVAPAIADSSSVMSGLHQQADDPLTAMALASAVTGEQSARPVVATSKALPKGFPTINFARSCHVIADASVGLAQGFDACVTGELSVRDQLAGDWDQFAQADRSSCVRLTTIGGGGTYTDLLTCLEIRRDAKNLQKENRQNGSVLVAGR